MTFCQNITKFDSKFSAMGFKQIREYVPVFYHKFLPPLFNEEIPSEAFTKCESCPMIAASREEMNEEVSKPFAPDTKCCTFMPRLPNYFAGAFLQDAETPLARKLLLQRIKERRGIFPQGIFPDKKYRLLYEYGRNKGFGKSLKLQCPFYLQGEYNCSLWKYRESVCATWFCKHLAGDAGKAFWDDMRDIFKMIQEKLQDHVIQKLSMSIVPPYGEDENLSSEDIDELAMSSKDYKLRWKQWEGKEEEFYIKSVEIINELSIDEFNRILGDDYAASLKTLTEKHQLFVTIPETLTLNTENTFEEVVPGRYRLQLRSYIDRNDTVITYAFDIPAVIIESFRAGGKVEEILKTLYEEHNIELGKDIVIALFQHGVLIRT
jgi:hypothetical protein